MGAVPNVIAPRPGPDDAWFWDGAREGRLLLRQCGACGRLQHPPTPLCPACGSASWTTREASGRGTVYAWLLSHHPTGPDAAPRIVVLVELAEGVRIVSNLVEVEPGDARNGMAVEACFVEYDGVVLPQFRPAAAAG
ncbi:MAG TPA: Zn-ribbon domain-containing OB-fold protein [Acidimicrobiales bacterium]|nr:Zn-ribbon domain-containing OB-fold protein [Acidimicrobiales bacterium]